MNALPSTDSLYAKFFGLQSEPFSIAPDPRYLFMSERHREALAHLLYGLRGGGGFVLLSGEIGAGKTTVCRCFLEQIPANCRVAYIFNPKLTVNELLRTVCDEFRIEHGLPADTGTIKPYVDALNDFLLRGHAAGDNAVLIIDEAQNLSAEVLEQLRLLTNLETSERKLLQIVLIGQPELRTLLARPELEQLAQRVIARFHLGALSEEETAQYVRHRLGVAGGASSFFDAQALRHVHRLSRGVPRRINLLCDRALLGSYAQGRKKVDQQTLEQAAAEVFDDGSSGVSPPSRQRVMAVAGVAGALVLGGAAWLLTGRNEPVAVAATPAAPIASAPAQAPAASRPALSPNISLGLLRESDAWTALATAWGADTAGLGDTPCQGLKTQGLQCYRSEGGGLSLLRQLDRPGILALRDGSGQPAYVLLVSLDGETATVRAGGRTQTVSLVSLSKQWPGEFLTLWRTPPGYAGRGALPPESADWMAQQLRKVLGDPAGATLPTQVAVFQRSQGLNSDGVPGPITLMQLSRAAGISEPRLLARPTQP